MYFENYAPLKPLAINNYPGICSVLAISKENVNSMMGLPDILTGTYPAARNTMIVADDDSDWLDICKQFNLQMQMSETFKETVQGNVYTYKLTFDINNDDYASRGAIIQAFDRREWILVVAERTGANRVLGSLARGADFSASLVTGAVDKGVNQFTCGFIWQTSERAFYINLLPVILINIPFVGSAPHHSPYRFVISNGTGSNTLIIQYSEDSGATWIFLPGTLRENVPDGTTQFLNVPDPVYPATVLVRGAFTVGADTYYSQQLSIDWS